MRLWLAALVLCAGCRDSKSAKKAVEPTVAETSDVGSLGLAAKDRGNTIGLPALDGSSGVRPDGTGPTAR
jgi:hypothetical protein